MPIGQGGGDHFNLRRVFLPVPHLPLPSIHRGLARRLLPQLPCNTVASMLYGLVVARGAFKQKPRRMRAGLFQWGLNGAAIDCTSNYPV